MKLFKLSSCSSVSIHAVSTTTIWIHKGLLDEVRLMRHGEGEVLKLNRADALLALTFLTSHSYNKGKKGPFCFQHLCTFK